MANEHTYRADHIGRLIVPAVLLEARERYARRELDLKQLRDAENIAIKSAIDMQRSVGIAATTDGAFRRFDGAAEALDGSVLAKSEAVPLRAMSRRPIKVAVPAARPAAGEPFDRVLGRAAIVKKEIDALIAAGVDYVQLDAPGYAVLFDSGNGRAPESCEDTSMLSIDDLLRLDAAALSGIDRPDNVRIAAHFVRPSHAIKGLSPAGQDAAGRLFHALPVDRFILPIGGEIGDSGLLRLVPKGKLVVLGIVSASSPVLESADDLMSWIDHAAKLIDGDDLALSTATGFAASQDMSEADQRRKLELIADVATRWWGFAM